MQATDKIDAYAALRAGIPLIDIVRRWLSNEALQRVTDLSHIAHMKIALLCSPAAEIVAIAGVYDMAPLLDARKRADHNRVEQERQAMADILITGPETEKVWVDELSVGMSRPRGPVEAQEQYEVSPGSIDAG